MKTKSILVVALALVSSVAFAFEPGNPKVVVINQKESGVFKLIYEGTKQGSVKMNIRNSGGDLLFSETIRNIDGFVRPINFVGMDPGFYTIEVIDANGKLSHQIEYTIQATVKKVAETRMVDKIYLAKIGNDQSKYLLAVTEKGVEKINVKIFDGENNLIHNESVAVNDDFGMVYNLKEVSGTPTFVITDKFGKSRIVRY